MKAHYDKDILIKNYNKKRNEAILEAVENGNYEPLRKMILQSPASKQFASVKGFPSDEMVAITARKMMFHTMDFSEEQRAAAGKWLVTHGYNVSLNTTGKLPSNKKSPL